MLVEIDVSGNIEKFDDIREDMIIDELITLLKIRFYNNDVLKHNILQKVSLKPLIISNKLSKRMKVGDIYINNSDIMKNQTKDNIKLYAEFSPETKRFKYNCTII